jgi:hypothetical protein
MLSNYYFLAARVLAHETTFASNRFELENTKVHLCIETSFSPVSHDLRMHFQSLIGSAPSSKLQVSHPLGRGQLSRQDTWVDLTPVISNLSARQLKQHKNMLQKV